MMQMLNAGGMPVLSDGIRPPDPDNPRDYFEFEPVKRMNHATDWVTSSAGRAVKVIHLLLPHLPSQWQYKVIFMNRDLAEVVRSQAVMLQRQGRQGAALPPERLAELLALQVQQTRRWMAGQPNVSCVDVEYVHVINQPATEARRVNEFLSGCLDEAAMAGVVDPALYRQRFRDGG